MYVSTAKKVIALGFGLTTAGAIVTGSEKVQKKLADVLHTTPTVVKTGGMVATVCGVGVAAKAALDLGANNFVSRELVDAVTQWNEGHPTILGWKNKGEAEAIGHTVLVPEDAFNDMMMHLGPDYNVRLIAPLSKLNPLT